MKRWPILAAVVLLLGFGVRPAGATVRQVPSPNPAIQANLITAQIGDTAQVTGGTRSVVSRQTGSPGALCWRAQPGERCQGMILTNFGIYSVLNGTELSEQPLRAVADYGVLFNVGARDAVGASLFASFDTEELVLGPAVRYRRWVGTNQSIDLAIGTPLVAWEGEAVLAPYGLIKYNPTHWVGFAVRPELRHYRVVNGCDVNSCGARRSHLVMSAGIELGWLPGFVMTPVFGLAALLVVASVANEN